MGHSELGNKKKKKNLARELVNTCYFSTSILLQIEKNVAELRAEVLHRAGRKEKKRFILLYSHLPQGGISRRPTGNHRISDGF